MNDTPPLNVCVFCGSKHGANPAYTVAARELGALLAARGLGLIYGGGDIGLMGEIANATLEASGAVIGVIPESLDEHEVTHRGVTELHVVGSMHERKALMADRADAFIALPGGFGTFEELFEILTWAQLGLHAKPCGLLNVEGFYDPLIEFLDHAVEHGFLKQKHRDILHVGADPADLLDRMTRYQAAPEEPKIEPSER
ncbi:MAG: LOG family protein [Planctomycetota bacterium]|jgi:uncharacterized protein (TIGR00730 family)